MGIKANQVTNNPSSSSSSPSSSPASPSPFPSGRGPPPFVRRKKQSQNTGRSAGIIIGSVVAVATVLGFVVFFLVRRRRIRQQTQGENISSRSNSVKEYQFQPHTELDGQMTAKMELSVDAGYAELETKSKDRPNTSGSIYELDSRVYA